MSHFFFPYNQPSKEELVSQKEERKPLTKKTKYQSYLLCSIELNEKDFFFLNLLFKSQSVYLNLPLFIKLQDMLNQIFISDNQLNKHFLLSQVTA